MLFHKSVRRGSITGRRAPFVYPRPQQLAHVQPLERRLLMAAGDLDGSFGTGGKVILPGVGVADAGDKVLLQTDGKVLLPATQSGGTGVSVTRLNADGTVDSGYGDGGTASVSQSELFSDVRDFELQADGKALLTVQGEFGSSSQPYTVRFTSGGDPDPGYGDGGIAPVPFLTTAQATAVSDGGVIVAGFASQQPTSVRVVRLLSDGSLDENFGDGGFVFIPLDGFAAAHAVRRQSDGKLLVLAEADNRTRVARLNADGTLDQNFGDGGVAFAPDAFGEGPRDFVLQSNGKIVVRRVNEVERPTSDAMLLRFNSNGTVDTGFGDQGIANAPSGSGNGEDGAIAIDSAGDIVTADTFHPASGPTDLRVAKFDGSTGDPDASFGSGGSVTLDLDGGGGSDRLGGVIVDSSKRVVVFAQIGISSSVPLAVARLFGDSTRPTANITPPVAVSGTAFTDFDVLFSDDVALNTQTIDAADVTVNVTGPQGAALGVTLQKITPGGGGASATATYRIAAPGGTWTDAANGTYLVAVKPDAVSDNAGNTNATTRINFTVKLAAPDAQPPAATLVAGAPPASGATNYQFAVTYTDNIGLASGNGTDDQVQVTGPNGFSQNATFVSATGSGTSRTFTYQITAPGGTFDPADNGTYAVSVTGTNAVADTTGNAVPAGQVGTFDVSLGVGAGNGPVASFPSGQPLPASGAATHDFTVSYADPNVVNASTIGNDDIVVTGPNGFSAPATLVSTGLNNGSIVTATYRIAAPGGTFDEVDNGTYSVNVQANAVTNIPGDPSPPGTIGTFQVTLGAASVGSLDPGFGGGTGVTSFDPPGPGLKTQDTIALADGSTVTVAFTNVALGSADVTLFKTTAQGTLDPTFGGSNNGLVSLNVGADDRVTGLAQLPDGRFVVSGTSSTYDGNGVETGARFFVARFNANGTVDTTFGNGAGFALSPAAAGVFDRANDLVALDDGTVLVFGQSTATDPSGDVAIARFTADGTFDTSFGAGGRVLTDLGGDDAANAVVLTSGGKFVVAGSTETDDAGSFAALRYNADGTLDTSFGGAGTGFVLIDFRPGLDDARAIVQQGDGALVLGGLASTGDPNDPAFDSDFALARLSADGVLDESFGSGGKVMTDFGILTTISKLVILPGGKIVASGQALNALGDIGTADVQVALARYNTDGSLDSTFSADGKVLINFEAAEAGSGALGASGLQSLAGEIVPLADADLTTLEQHFEQFRQEAQGLIAVTQGGAILAIATQGNEVEVARVIGDAGAPSALVALLPNVTETDVENVTFIVRYIDDLAVDTSTIGTGDIRVTGPNGFAQDAVFVGFVGGSDPAPEITARYTVNAPSNGAFLKGDEGSYALSIGDQQVADVNGNTLAGQPIPNAAFTVTVPENLANLHVDGALTGKFPASVVGGAKTKGATFKLTNTGQLDAKTTVAVTVFASADQTFDEAEDTSIAVINGVKLSVKPGKGKTVKLKFTQFPSTLPDGDYYVIARVDSGSALSELKKSDNNAVTATPINIAKPFTELSGSPGAIKGTLTPGAKVSASALVANAGNVAVKATVPVAIVASPGDQTLGNGDTTIATPNVKMSINAGSSKNVKLSFTLPATGLAPGTYSLLAVLDAGGTLTTEKNTANNVVVLGEFTVS